MRVLGIYSRCDRKRRFVGPTRSLFRQARWTYQIHPNVRDICTFARQNIAADPPFSRLDLISCHNVLYLSPELQKRCIPQFHYALNPRGYGILGPAESVGLYDELFKVVDKKNKIYTKAATTPSTPAELIPQTVLNFHDSGRRPEKQPGQIPAPIF